MVVWSRYLYVMVVSMSTIQESCWYVNVESFPDLYHTDDVIHSYCIKLIVLVMLLFCILPDVDKTS